MSRPACIACALALLTLAGCASSPPGTVTTSSATRAETAPPASVAQPAGSTSTASSWVISGITAYAPADAPGEAANPDPDFDFGYVVQIVAGGFHPHDLVAGCCRAVTWRNLTGREASIVFDHQQVASGSIPPGGSFVFTPTTPVSITYHSALDPSQTGHVQVQQEFDS